MLTAAAHEAGATAFRVGTVPDDPRALLSAIEDQLIRADLVVTTGGVSVGAYDVVKEVLSRLGTVTFDKVAMQPGMPQGRGIIGPDATPIFTLPGNPVSAYVSFEVFVPPGDAPDARRRDRRPARGAGCLPRALQLARGASASSRAARSSVEEGRYVVRPLTGQASHHVRDLGARQRADRRARGRHGGRGRRHRDGDGPASGVPS